jgi:Leucine-rich repeat (LRR) protein
LSQLKCDKTKITDAGLLALTNCTALEELDASGTPITDTGVKHIAKMPNLSNLTLLRTKVTRKSLGVLTSFPNLAMVYLSTRSMITGDDLEELNKKKLKLMIVLVQDDE